MLGSARVLWLVDAFGIVFLRPDWGGVALIVVAVCRGCLGGDCGVVIGRECVLAHVLV